MEGGEKIKFKEVLKTLMSVPKTIKLISSIEKSNLKILIIFSAIMGLMPLISLYVYQELINNLSTGNFFTDRMIYIIIIYVVISVVNSFLMEIYGYMNSKFNLNLGYKINKLILEKASTLSLNNFETPETYNIVEKITQESSYKPFQIMSSILGIITAMLTLVTSMLYISTWNYYLALLIISVPIFSLIIFLKIGQLEFVIQWKRANDERKTWYWIYLLTHDFSFKEIKLNGLKNYMIGQFSTLKERFIGEDLKLLKKKNIFNVLLEMVLQIIELIIIVIGIFALRSGELLIGSFVTILRALGIINNSSQSIVQDIYIIYNSSLYMEQLFNFINDTDRNNVLLDEKINNNINDKSNNIDSIKIESLNFQYPNGTMGVNNVNLELGKGELVAIVGKNGSGKSTLVKLLSGLYKGQSGRIFYDEISDDKLGENFYSNNVSVLFQDFTKYELTLRENIGFGYIEDLNNSSKMIGLLDKMNMDFLKENGSFNLNMQLGNWFNDGRQLSGGQWQKIGLVRALIKPASLYILDEPNAALDSVSEKSVFDTFLEYSKESIAIFVSHKISAARKADRIIVMDNGSITCEGSHDYLLSNNETYKELYLSEKYEENLQGE